MTLTRYTLSPREDGQWALTREGSDRATKLFATKAEATAGGALEAAIGADGGSVRIQRADGQFEEERTFPRSADPARSPG
jgi:hypothetical protein